MDIKPDSQKNQSISDDQELAKVLAGVNQAADEEPSTVTPDATMPTPSTPMPDAPQVVPTDNAADDSSTDDMPAMPAPAEPMPAAEPTSAPSLPSDLDSIKQEALGELRPLVDKLNVSPEEKFDTYLLLLRSTDDKDLIAPAHEAAKNITDEARKAQALLDIIKEIDFFGQNNQAAQ